MKKFFDFLIGRSLANNEECHQKIGAAEGIPVLGLDALSSSAYGPEAAATVLIALGSTGVAYVLPITLAIVALLIIVYFSYRQTLSEYPHGGGSYTVAKENLGVSFGLLAAAALLLDYVLVVAVGISAGVGALVSALPSLQPHMLALCLITLTLITIINLRGVKESGFAFMLPTYFFVGTMTFVLAWGLYKTILSGGHPIAEQAPPISIESGAAISFWILARAFASGCTAMTGVEAVSNGINLFKTPVVQTAKRTLTAIVMILVFLLVGISYLARAYGVTATDPTSPQYQSLISILVAAIAGRGFVYYTTLFSVVAVLLLSANTGFADFPRLCQILARDNYMPHSFAERGRRLVFSYGIITISVMSAILLIIFNGLTDHLIPLFAVGAFLAFTLSQSGMVAHWLRSKNKNTAFSIFINSIGALATGITLIVVLVSKFADGAWITILLMTLMFFIFHRVRRHYVKVAQEIRLHQPLDFSNMRNPVVIVPMRGWSKISNKAMRFALNISDEIYGVHVDNEGTGSDYVKEQWEKYITSSALKASVSVPKLVTLQSPYRQMFSSLLNFISELEVQYPDRQIVVLIPNLVEEKWYHYFLHNQRAFLLEAALRLRADPRVITINVPWYL